MLAPDGFEFEGCVLLDHLLDVLDVGFVERRHCAVLADTHVLDECLVVKGQGSQDLEGRAGDTALVGRGILEENAAGLLQAEFAVLGDEEIGALDHVGDNGLAILDELANAGEVDGLGPSTAGHEDVVRRVRAQVERVAEDHAIVDDLAAW